MHKKPKEFQAKTRNLKWGFLNCLHLEVDNRIIIVAEDAPVVWFPFPVAEILLSIFCAYQNDKCATKCPVTTFRMCSLGICSWSAVSYLHHWFGHIPEVRGLVGVLAQSIKTLKPHQVIIIKDGIWTDQFLRSLKHIGFDLVIVRWENFQFSVGVWTGVCTSCSTKLLMWFNLLEHSGCRVQRW